MTREYAGALRERYKANCTDLREVPSQVELHTFVRTLDTELTSSLSEGKGNGEEIWYLECMVTAKEIASSGLRDKLQEAQHVYKEAGNAGYTTILEVV